MQPTQRQSIVHLSTVENTESRFRPLTLDLRFRWLVLAWIHLSAIFVEGPERIPEHARRIVLFLERDQALPILAKGGGYARGHLVPSKELHVVPLYMRTL